MDATDLPIIYKSDSWVKHRRNFGLSDEDLENVLRNSDGDCAIMLLQDDLLIEIMRRIQIHSRILGTSQADLHKNGEHIYELLFLLMRKELPPSELSELCNHLVRLNSTDFEALQRFWDFRYDPDQVVQGLYIRLKTSGLSLPENFLPAIENLRILARYPSSGIPTSLPVLDPVSDVESNQV